MKYHTESHDYGPLGHLLHLLFLFGKTQPQYDRLHQSIGEGLLHGFVQNDENRENRNRHRHPFIITVIRHVLRTMKAKRKSKNIKEERGGKGQEGLYVTPYIHGKALPNPSSFAPG
jgi:hypothetical protein